MDVTDKQVFLSCQGVHIWLYAWRALSVLAGVFEVAGIDLMLLQSVMP